MKNSKKLKLVLEILICILIILIGIVGVYTKSSNMYKNVFPHSYTLASDIDGAIVIEFTPDDSVETIYYDKEGKKVDSSTITDKNKKDYEAKEIPVNAEEDLNSDNYNSSLNIMKERLELLDANQYQLSVDEKIGIISLIVEDDYLEDIESFLQMEGKLQLIDSITEDVIIDYSDFKSAEASYASLITEYRTYISLKLNDSGIEKIKNIDKYKVTETKEEGKEPEESKILVSFDGETISEVSYDDILLNGKTLRITTAKNLTEDSKINSQINIDMTASKLATIGKMPVVYNLTAEEFVQNDLKNDIKSIVMILVVTCVIVSVILIIKHRLKGVLGVLGFATNISIFLIIIRLTKIQISLNGFAGMIGLIFLNMFLINNILKCIKNKDKVFTENIKDAYLKTINQIVIILITLIILAVSSMTVISSGGLLLFWGWIITVCGNLAVTVSLLATVTNR